MTYNFDNLSNRYLESLMSCVRSTSEYLPDDENVRESLEDFIKGYCEIDFKNEKSRRAMDKLRRHLNGTNEVNIDVDALFNRYLEEDETEFDYKNSDVWRLYSNENNVEVVQPKRAKKRSSGPYIRMNDSVLCSDAFEVPRDPITKKIIREPCRNKFCGHIFELETIMNYIKKKKGNVKCPYIGCANSTFEAPHLKVDEELKKKIHDFLTNQSNSDDSD